MAARVSPKKRDQVRADYLAGAGTLRELAKKHRAGISTVLRWAATDGWVEARERIGIKARAKADEKIVDSQAEMLARHVGVARQIQGKALATLEAVDTFDPEGLAQVARAVKLAAAMERLAVGLFPDRPADTSPSDRPRARLIIETADGQRIEASSTEAA